MYVVERYVDLEGFICSLEYEMETRAFGLGLECISYRYSSGIAVGYSIVKHECIQFFHFLIVLQVIKVTRDEREIWGCST